MYEDALGAAILELCSVIPHGVLCFFPSYTIIQKLLLRWNSTGLSKKLRNAKYVAVGIKCLIATSIVTEI